jgi:hypothetical protein
VLLIVFFYFLYAGFFQQGTPQIMPRDMDDLDKICPSNIIEVISMGSVVEYNCDARGHTGTNQHEIYWTWIMYIYISTNIILNYIRATNTIYWGEIQIGHKHLVTSFVYTRIKI